MKKTRSRAYIDDLVLGYIRTYYPVYDIPAIHHRIIQDVKAFDDVFSRLWKIYNDRDMYNLTWAFGTAQTEFRNVISTIVHHDVEPMIQEITQTLMKSPDTNQKLCITIASDDFIFHRLFAKIIRSYKSMPKRLSFLSTLIDIIDICLSAGVILILSIGADAIGVHVYGEVLGILFVIVMAIIKATIDKFLVESVIHTWGRNIYINHIEKFKKIFARFLCIHILLNHVIHNDRDYIGAVDVLHRGILVLRAR